MTTPKTPVDQALENQDPYALAGAATTEELERMKAAEAVLEARRNRLKFGNRFHIASQALVGYVALLGLGVNAYQSWVNKNQAQQQQRVDQERWSKEFDRAQQADKYRAFFETSLLATDETNRDKRLVGYALLEEFVSDPAYNTKATLMLEESLLQELKRHEKSKREVFDAEQFAAVEAILTALSDTPDCAALERAARSIDRVAQHKTESGHTDESSRLFGLYVRRLVGRAAQICGTMRELRLVKAPILTALVNVPELGGFPTQLSGPEANERIAQVLGADCTQEILVSGATECPKILSHYAELCVQGPDIPEEMRACEVMKNAAAELPKGQ
jgi:hypothetical protein